MEGVGGRKTTVNIIPMVILALDLEHMQVIK